jgi:hypothetical protein
VDFPEVPAVETEFTITVFDDCDTATVMVGTQTFKKVIF